jgi:hypothetical protein
MNALGAQNIAAKRLNHRVERNHGGTDPISERRLVDVDPLAPVSFALAIERQMQQELGDQHHREQARSCKPTGNRTGWRRRFGDRLAIPARKLLTHMLDDLPAPRFAFQRFRHHLAELAQANAAAFAARTRWRFDDPFDRQIVRQRPAWLPRRTSLLLLGAGRRRHLELGLFRRLRFFEVLDGKLELLDQMPGALGRLAVLLAPCLGQHELVAFDLKPADGQLALRQAQHLTLGDDHRVRGGKVVRKWIEGRRHTRDSS